MSQILKPVVDVDVIRESISLICSAKLCSINSMSSRDEMLRLLEEAKSKLTKAIGDE